MSENNYKSNNGNGNEMWYNPRMDCIVYGLRARGADCFFYVGSTKEAATYRLGAHLTAVRLGRNKNRHFCSKIRAVGAENVEIVELARTDKAQRWLREGEWIARLLIEGHPLVNIQLRPEIYDLPPVEETQAEARRAAWKTMCLFGPSRGPISPYSRPGDIALSDACEALAIKLLKTLLDDGEGWLRYLGYAR